MLSAQGGSHQQAHLWKPQTEGQHQFSHLVRLPTTKNRCDDTNMTFSSIAKHWPHNGLTLFKSHYKASFIIHFFILIPVHTIISSFAVPPCGCAFLYYMLKAQLFFSVSTNTPQLAYSILIVQQFLHQEHTPHREHTTWELWLPW
jgi:hypothetical protein